MISYDKALSAVAERTVSNHQDISQRKKQRRTGFVDLYGVESFRSVTNEADFYYSVSLDVEYFERFQFKLVVDDSTAIGNVEIWVSKPASTEPPINLTPYLMEQHGSWITGDGIYPTDDITEASEWNDFYDILDACGLLYVSEDADLVDEQILSSGLHKFTIKGLTANVSLILYMKYSHINR